MARTIAVTGARGAQQGAVVDALSRAGHVVRATSRTPPPSDAPPGVEWREADPLDRAGLDGAFDGVDAVVFTVPQDHRDGAMLAMTERVAGAARRAGVERLVVNLASGIDEAADTPLFRTMRAVRDAALGGSPDVVVLEPTVYLDNLLAPWTLSGILERGTLAYPAPADAAISWLSHDALGEHARAACDPAVAAGRSYRVGGPRPIAGDELARVVARRTGRDVRYARLPPDAFAAGMNAAVGAPAGDRVAELYRALDARPDAHALSDPDPFGVGPESVEEFVSRALPAA